MRKACPCIDVLLCFVVDSNRCRHNESDGVSNLQPHHRLLNRFFRRKSKLRVTGLCDGNSPVTGELPARRTSNAENVFIWWRHHDLSMFFKIISQQYFTNFAPSPLRGWWNHFITTTKYAENIFGFRNHTCGNVSKHCCPNTTYS